MYSDCTRVKRPTGPTVSPDFLPGTLHHCQRPPVTTGPVSFSSPISTLHDPFVVRVRDPGSPSPPPRSRSRTPSILIVRTSVPRDPLLDDLLLLLLRSPCTNHHPGTSTVHPVTGVPRFPQSESTSSRGGRDGNSDVSEPGSKTTRHGLGEVPSPPVSSVLRPSYSHPPPRPGSGTTGALGTTPRPTSRGFLPGIP